MTRITVTDTLELSIPERIHLVEDIWDTISAKASSVELTDEEKKIIDARLEKYHKNPELGSPWAEVYKRSKQTVKYSVAVRPEAEGDLKEAFSLNVKKLYNHWLFGPEMTAGILASSAEGAEIEYYRYGWAIR